MSPAEQEAARRWMRGDAAEVVGEPLGLGHPQSVYKWARRMGLPARVRHPRGRPVGAVAHIGRREFNGRNSRRKVRGSHPAGLLVGGRDSTGQQPPAGDAA